MEVFLHTAVPMEDKVQIVLCLLDQLQVQRLQLDVQMVECHHIVVRTEDKDQTVLYQLDLQRDQLKATNIYLRVQMEEPVSDFFSTKFN